MPLKIQDLRASLATRKADDQPAGRHAAVAAIVHQNAKGTDVLLIRRAERDGDPWSGHMGFPGGHHEPNDVSLRHTALRETYEELGVVLSDEHWVGRLDDVPTHRTGMVVRPFVFQVEDRPVVKPNGEVAEVLWASLDGLAAGRHDTEHPFDVRGTLHRFPAYDVEGRIVWGLTYRMLRVLLDLWQPTP